MRSITVCGVCAMKWKRRREGTQAVPSATHCPLSPMMLTAPVSLFPFFRRRLSQSCGDTGAKTNTKNAIRAR